jgi:transcriptional regulator with AAA-type ATPase domain
MADKDPATGEQIAFLETTISKLESELVASPDIDSKRRNALIFLIEDAHNRVARINRSRARPRSAAWDWRKQAR